MIEIIFNGVELGVILAFLVGPVFFTIIQTSIERGFWKGVLVALGVSLSDNLYVVICYFGFAQIMLNSNFHVYMAYGGGTIIICFGLYYLLVKSRRKVESNPGSVIEKKLYRHVVKGFLINGMTPTVLIFWIGTASLATIHFGYVKKGEFALFFGSLLGTVLATDVLKAYLAAKLSKLLTPKSIKIMNIILGIILILFGFRLLFSSKTISIF